MRRSPDFNHDIDTEQPELPGMTPWEGSLVEAALFPEKPDYVRLNILVTKEQKRALRLRAAVTEASISSWIREAIDEKAAREDGRAG